MTGCVLREGSYHHKRKMPSRDSEGLGHVRSGCTGGVENAWHGVWANIRHIFGTEATLYVKQIPAKRIFLESLSVIHIWDTFQQIPAMSPKISAHLVNKLIASSCSSFFCQFFHPPDIQ